MSETARTSSVSAVVVTYNSSAMIGSCLTGLQRSLRGAKDEIVVVDNVSMDGTAEKVEAEHAGVRVVRMERNVGFAGGVNKGIESTTGDYVLVVNPDVIVDAVCVDGLVDFLARHEDAAAVSPLLVDGTGEVIPSRRRYPTVRGILTNRFGFLRRVIGDGARRRYLMLDDAFTGVADVDWLSGGCLLMSRKALAEIGMLDDGFFMYFEDTDWCWRARRKGWRVCYDPGQKAGHDAQRESSRGLNRLFLCHVRSMMRFYRKHGLRV